ncbi:Fanconi anemia group G homolog, partial [Paramuricea clavata]
IAHNCLILKRYSEACEFFGQLLAQLNNKPVDLQECRITSIPTLHKEFAEALFNCDRWDDCLVVCEKILKQETVSNTLSKTLFSQDKAKLDTGKTLIDIMLCKAVVLKELQRPIEANECYESILDAINNNYSESSGEQTNLDEPQQKKQKREKGPTEQHLENYIEMQKFKALTLNKQSLLLSSLGRKKEALLLLTQSISCEPDCLKYRFNHTKLLFDMGMDDVARKDWLKFRRIDQTTSSSDSKENFKLKDLPEDDEDRDLYLQMDSLALSRLSAKS